MKAYDAGAWKKTRETHLMTYPGCVICGTTEDLHVHHLRYRGPRGLSERPGDLVTLCRDHHDGLHRTIRKNRVGLVQGTLDYIATARLIESLL